jgi:hypothetical protein
MPHLGIENRDLVEFMDHRPRIHNQFHALKFGGGNDWNFISRNERGSS